MECSSLKALENAYLLGFFLVKCYYIFYRFIKMYVKRYSAGQKFGVSKIFL